MTTQATGPWYEVQGLVDEPEEGWHAIFFVDTRSECEETLAFVMESTSPVFDRYEDFRMAVPDTDALKRRRKAVGYAWDRRAPRKIESTSRNTVASAKGKRKTRAA